MQRKENAVCLPEKEDLKPLNKRLKAVVTDKLIEISTQHNGVLLDQNGKQYRLTNTVIKVFRELFMVHHNVKTNQCNPNQTYLAEKLNRSRSYINKAIQILVKTGLIYKKQRKVKYVLECGTVIWRQLSNEYFFPKFLLKKLSQMLEHGVNSLFEAAKRSIVKLRFYKGKVFKGQNIKELIATQFKNFTGNTPKQAPKTSYALENIMQGKAQTVSAKEVLEETQKSGIIPSLLGHIVPKNILHGVISTLLPDKTLDPPPQKPEMTDKLLME